MTVTVKRLLSCLCDAGVAGAWAVHHMSSTDTGMQLDNPGGPHHSYLLMSHPAAFETKVN